MVGDVFVLLMLMLESEAELWPGVGGSEDEELGMRRRVSGRRSVKESYLGRESAVKKRSGVQ